MDYEKLRNLLESLTVKQLKNICANSRLWGVYNSRTSYTGYSKCRNKKELIEFIINHNKYYERPSGLYFQDKRDQWSYEEKYYDFEYGGENLNLHYLFSVMYQLYPDKNKILGECG